MELKDISVLDHVNKTLLLLYKFRNRYVHKEEFSSEYKEVKDIHVTMLFTQLVKNGLAFEHIYNNATEITISTPLTYVISPDGIFLVESCAQTKYQDIPYYKFYEDKNEIEKLNKELTILQRREIKQKRFYNPLAFLSGIIAIKIIDNWREILKFLQGLFHR